MDDEGRLAVREGARHPADAALRAWLFEHRLRALHLAAARSVESAVGPLAGAEARMRDSHSTAKSAREAGRIGRKAGPSREYNGATIRCHCSQASASAYTKSRAPSA